MKALALMNGMEVATAERDVPVGEQRTIENEANNQTPYITEVQLKQIGISTVTATKLNEILDKYEITDLEPVRHFLAQSSYEIGTKNSYIEVGNLTYFNNKYAPYIGAGGIQLTHEYNYKAFATYLLLDKYAIALTPMSPKNKGLAAIDKLYTRVVRIAAERIVDKNFDYGRNDGTEEGKEILDLANDIVAQNSAERAAKRAAERGQQRIGKIVAETLLDTVFNIITKQEQVVFSTERKRSELKFDISYEISKVIDSKLEIELKNKIEIKLKSFEEKEDKGSTTSNKLSKDLSNLITTKVVEDIAVGITTDLKTDLAKLLKKRKVSAPLETQTIIQNEITGAIPKKIGDIENSIKAEIPRIISDIVDYTDLAKKRQVDLDEKKNENEKRYSRAEELAYYTKIVLPKEIEDKFKASEVSDQEVKDYTTNFSASEYVATEFTWESAGFFWYSQNINEVATANAVDAVTGKINSGLAHMKEEEIHIKGYVK